MKKVFPLLLALALLLPGPALAEHLQSMTLAMYSRGPIHYAEGDGAWVLVAVARSQDKARQAALNGAAFSLPAPPVIDKRAGTLYHGRDLKGPLRQEAP